MRVLHLLASGNIGGIEILCKNVLQKADWDNRICFLFEEGKIYQELKQEKYNVFSLKQEGRNKRKIVDKLKAYCKKEKIDIVTVHHGGLSCNVIYIMLQKQMPQIKYVRYLHGVFDQYTYGNSSNKIKNYLIKIVMQKAFNVSDLLIFISEAVKISFEEKFKIEKVNTVVIYNGIDKKFFENQRERNVKEERSKIVFIGRVEKEKGVSILVEAIKQLWNKGYDVHLTVVGDGSERKKLEDKVKFLKLENNIEFVGSQMDVIKWLDNADLFIYPSICEEGFGISVIEAMARGCIPITFYKGGLPEIIENRKSGFMIEKVDSEELAKKVIEVLKMNNKEKISQKAMHRSEKFSIDETIENLRFVYKGLLK